MSKPKYTYSLGYTQLLVEFGEGDLFSYIFHHTCSKIIVSTTAHEDKYGYEVKFRNIPLKIRYYDAKFETTGNEDEDIKKLLQDVFQNIPCDIFFKWLTNIKLDAHDDGRKSFKDDVRKLLG